MKKVYARERKGSARTFVGLSLFVVRWKTKAYRIKRLLSAFAFVSFSAPPQLASVFERPTLRGCQCDGALGRVKPLRTLTLPCQRTNPDGVICGGKHWKFVLCGVWNKCYKLIWGGKHWNFNVNRMRGKYDAIICEGKCENLHFWEWGLRFRWYYFRMLSDLCPSSFHKNHKACCADW